MRTARTTLATALAAVAVVALSSAIAGGRPAHQLEPPPPVPAVLSVHSAAPGEDANLAVVASRPTGEAGAKDEIAIVFSKPVVALDPDRGRRVITPLARISPPVEGEWRWLGSAGLQFVPAASLPMATHFEVVIEAGVRALDGSELPSAHRFEFDTPRPKLLRSFPSDGYRWARSDQEVHLVFNQPVSDLAKHVRLRIASFGSTIPLELVPAPETANVPARPGRWSVCSGGDSETATRYVLRPLQPIPESAPVAIEIDAELRGLAGPRSMGEVRKVTFRTAGPMAIDGLHIIHDRFDQNADARGPIGLVTSNPPDPVRLVPFLREHLRIEPKVEINWDAVRVVEPDPDGKSTKDGEGQPELPFILLPGKFRPATEYSISVSAGLMDSQGHAAEAFSSTLRTSAWPPEFKTEDSEFLLESERDRSIPLLSVNLTSVHAKVWSLSVAEYARLPSCREPISSGYDPAPCLPKRAPGLLELDVSADRNVGRWVPLRPADALSTANPASGIYLIEATAAELPKEEPHRLLAQVTDMSVHARIGSRGGVVWVTRISTGEAVAGADVSVIDGQGKTRWSGATDATGLARVAGLPKLTRRDSDGFPFAVVSARKGDLTGVTRPLWSASLVGEDKLTSSEWEDSTSGPRGALFTDRNIYRPSERVYVSGILRMRGEDAVRSLPKGTQLKLVAKGKDHARLFEATVAIDAFGVLQSSFDLPKDSKLGPLAIEATATIAGSSLTWTAAARVSEYRASALTAKLTPEVTDVAAGAPLRATLQAEHLYGSAMQGAPFWWRVRREETSFEPPGNEGFEFTTLESGESVGGDFSRGQGILDARGRASITAATAESQGGQSWEYTLEAEVSDLARRRVAERCSWTVHPAAVFAGVQAPPFARHDLPVQLQAVAVNADGHRIQGLPLAIEVAQRIVKDDKPDEPVGASDPTCPWYRARSRSQTIEDSPVFACLQTSAAEPVSCEFRPPQSGTYVVSATATDDKGRTHASRTTLEIGDYDSSPDESLIALKPERTQYAVGETARIVVMSPLRNVEALVTVERAGIMSTQRMRLKAFPATIEVPISEVMIPTAYVAVTLVRGRMQAESASDGKAKDSGEPVSKSEVVRLEVDTAPKRLAVALRPDHADKRPGERVDVEIEVRDAANARTEADLVVWAVDEAVLQLTRYSPPDLVASVHPPARLSMGEAACFGAIPSPVQYGADPSYYFGERGLGLGWSNYGRDLSGYGSIELGGPGGGKEQTPERVFRSEFVTTPFFKVVKTDVRGRARVHFQLPDNLTTYRLMAVAATRGDKFGTAEAKVVVSKPLLAVAAVPRLARVGDRFEAGVVVHAQEPSARQGALVVRVEAEGVVVDGSMEQTVASLGETGEREVRFAFRAEKPGTARLRFAVDSATERDGVEATFPVKLPVKVETLATYGETRDRRVEAIAAPGRVQPGIGGFEVSLFSTALSGFEGAVRQLVTYPYNCTEQLSSALIPAIALRELRQAFGTPPTSTLADAAAKAWFDEEALSRKKLADPDALAREHIKAIEERQLADGSFSFWKGLKVSSPYASVYATLALQRAHEVGYAVTGSTLQAAKRYLRETIAPRQCVQAKDDCYLPSDELRAFALYVLARSRTPVPEQYSELFGKRDQLSIAARAMLADAMFVGGGDREQARQLMAEIMNKARESEAGAVQFEERRGLPLGMGWSSNTRTAAIVLQTMADVSPDHPYVAKIARSLARARRADGSFRNTQEAAFALMAMTEVLRSKEREAPSFTAKVSLGDREIAAARFEGRSTTVRRSALPLEALATAGGAHELTFAKEGPGVLYYLARLRYAPLEMPTEPIADRGLVVQRWFEPLDGGGQVRSAAAGESLRMRVRVATSMERRFVVVELPLPAGLEGVDSTLLTSATPEFYADLAKQPAAQTKRNKWQRPHPLEHSFYSPFNLGGFRDDSAMLVAERLPPGVYEESFIVRAMTPGEFVLPAAWAEEMYSPEVYGRSEGGSFRVEALP